jgi:hypothetical protein
MFVVSFPISDALAPLVATLQRKPQYVGRCWRRGNAFGLRNDCRAIALLLPTIVSAARVDLVWEGDTIIS